MLLQINADYPQPRQISKVTETLEQGGLIACPTDTSYGIACDMEQRRTYDRIYSVRKRGSGKPLTLICADIEMVSQYALVDNASFRILKRHLPGSYTFILPASPSVPRSLMPKRKEVGIRIPDHPVPREITRALGRPLVTGTAQLGESAPFTDPYEVNDVFGGVLEMVVDAGMLSGGVTTVVSLLGDEPDVIRKGVGVEQFDAGR